MRASLGAWLASATIALTCCGGEPPETAVDQSIKTETAEEPIIGYIHHARLLSADELDSGANQKQMALLFSKYDQCSLTGEKACPIRDADVLLLSGVRIEYSICNQYARSVEFSNGPVEYGFFGNCSDGVTETFLAMKQLMGVPLPTLPFKDLVN